MEELYNDKFIIKFITPIFLFFVMGFWVIQKGRSVLFMEGVSAQDKPYVFLARIVLIALVIALALLIKIKWRSKISQAQQEEIR